MRAHARQEEDRGQGQEARRAQAAQARHRRRRQDRLTAHLASWWERYPAELDAHIKELTDAGFRVHREIGEGGRLALNVEKDGETHRVIYQHAVTRHGERLYVVSPWPNARVWIGAGSATPLWAIQKLKQGRGTSLFDHDAGCVFIPAAFARDITGAGGLLRLGRSRVTCGSYALRGLTGTTALFDAADGEFMRAFPDEMKGLWARGRASDTGLGLETLVSEAEAIAARAHELPVADVRAGRHGIVGLVSSVGSSSSQWQFVRRGERGEPILLRNQVRTPLDYARRAPFSKRLDKKLVALIGCGAVGWSVALELARSGVQSFVLYDDDQVQPYNLARLPTFLGAAGRAKVDVLAEQLEAIAPGVSAEARPWLVGISVGTSGLVSDSPDLIVNLSGEEISTDETNAASIILGRPAIYGWITNGVLAARMFRVRAGETPCYNCLREAEPEPLPTSGPLPRPGDLEAAWTGAGFNVDAFASALARMAVLTLAGEPVSDRENPDHVVLRFGGPVPVAKALRFKRDPRCWWCR